jgi:hypothetical protein
LVTEDRATREQLVLDPHPSSWLRGIITRASMSQTFFKVLKDSWKMSTSKGNEVLSCLSAKEQRIMRQLLQTPPETHKAATKPISPQAEAQRRRRDKERKHFSEASRDI